MRIPLTFARSHSSSSCRCMIFAGISAPGQCDVTEGAKLLERVIWSFDINLARSANYVESP